MTSSDPCPGCGRPLDDDHSCAPARERSQLYGSSFGWTRLTREEKIEMYREMAADEERLECIRLASEDAVRAGIL